MVYGVDQSVDRSQGQSQFPEPKDDIFLWKRQIQLSALCQFTWKNKRGIFTCLTINIKKTVPDLAKNKLEKHNH